MLRASHTGLTACVSQGLRVLTHLRGFISNRTLLEFQLAPFTFSTLNKHEVFIRKHRCVYDVRFFPDYFFIFLYTPKSVTNSSHKSY